MTDITFTSGDAVIGARVGNFELDQPVADDVLETLEQVSSVTEYSSFPISRSRWTT